MVRGDRVIACGRLRNTLNKRMGMMGCVAQSLLCFLGSRLLRFSTGDKLRRMQGAKDWTSEVCNELVVLEGFSGHQELQGLASALSFALTLFFVGGVKQLYPAQSLFRLASHHRHLRWGNDLKRCSAPRCRRHLLRMFSERCEPHPLSGLGCRSIIPTVAIQ